MDRFNNEEISQQRVTIIEKYNRASTVLELLNPSHKEYINEHVEAAIELAKMAMECLIDDEMEKEYRDKGLLGLDDTFKHDCGKTKNLTKAINEFLFNKVLRANASATKTAEKLIKLIRIPKIKVEPDVEKQPSFNSSFEGNSSENDSLNSDQPDINKLILSAFLEDHDDQTIINNLLKGEQDSHLGTKQLIANKMRQLQKRMERIANTLDPLDNLPSDSIQNSNQETNSEVTTSNTKSKQDVRQSQSPKIISHQTRGNKLMLTVVTPVNNTTIKPRKIITLEKALEEDKEMVLKYLEEVKGRRSNSYNSIISKYHDILKEFM